MISDVDDDGRVMVEFSEPVSGRVVKSLTPEEINGMLYKEETAENPTGEQNAEQEQEPGTAEESAFERIPKDEEGNPQYTQTDAPTAWDAIVEQTEGDEDMARSVVDSTVKDKEAALKKLESSNPKPGATVAEKIAAAKEHKAAIEAARQELEQWKAIAEVENRRKAEAEAKAKAAEEEAKAKAKAEAEEEEKTDESAERYPVGLDEEESSALMERMEAEAAEIPLIELNPANWIKEFGEKGIVSTPIGEVKMGENQIAKLFEKGRSNQFGMIRPTLETPQLIIEVPSFAADGNSERGSSLLFVKTFTDSKGRKIYYFKSVTVKKDGLEVSVSSHYDRPKRIKEALKKGKLLYRFDGGAQTEQRPADVSVATSREVSQGTSLAGKVSESPETKQEKAENSISARVKEASADVNTEPTEAQKEAGNYKKGHVQVGTFDITIEQPEGSIRRGTDADGKQWESKMHNTYGYFRGTEGVDGDHIDVFLSNDMDGWNGAQVFVVDQYNPDGTFDEHKVMLGFNDTDDAKSNYLANYEKGWENGRRIDVSAVNLEDFEKWIASSRRKTKPFSEYSSVNKETATNTPAEEEAEAKTTQKENKGKTVYSQKEKNIYDAKLDAVIKAADIEEEIEYLEEIKEDPGADKKAVQSEIDRLKAEKEEFKAKAEEERRKKFSDNMGSRYSLSDEYADNGEAFVKNEKGSTHLIEIPNEIFDRLGISPLPFKLTESMALHVFSHHAKELKLKTLDDAIDFVLSTIENADHVRLGRDNSYVFSVENGKDRVGKRAITIVIGNNAGEFIGIRTSGYESIKKLKERPLLWERSAKTASEDVATPTITTIESPHDDETSSRAKSQSNGSSADKVSESSETKQEKAEKSISAKVKEASAGEMQDIEAEIKRLEEIKDYPGADKKLVQSEIDRLKAEKEAKAKSKNVQGTNKTGAFGTIYTQFKGKAKEAIAFLLEKKEGEAVGALHHKDIGNISLVWGNEKAGLQKIAKKHPEVLDNLQEIIGNMDVSQSSDNRIILESDTHKAVVSKKLGKENTPQWLLTAYEKKDASGGSSDIVPEPKTGKQNGTAPLQDTVSTGKVSESPETKQEKKEKSEEVKSKSKEQNGVDDAKIDAALEALDKGREKAARRLASKLTNKELSMARGKAKPSFLLEYEWQWRAQNRGDVSLHDWMLENQYVKPAQRVSGTFRITDYTAPKDSPYAERLGGVYHDKSGFAVATDGRILVASKDDFDPKLKGKVAGKDGTVSESKYPDWQKVVLSVKETKPSRIDVEGLRKFVAGVLRANRRAYISLCFPDGTAGAFKAAKLNLMLRAMKQLGTSELLYTKDGMKLVAKSEKGTALLMGLVSAEDELVEANGYAYPGNTVSYRKGYSDKKETTAKTEPQQPSNAISERASQSASQSNGIMPASSNGKPTVSADKVKDSSDTKQEKDEKSAEDRQNKIIDAGEKIAGARKDLLRDFSNKLKETTLESLITLPFSKAFKRPDLKTAVEHGLLRQRDARFAEAVMATYLSKNKPRLLSGWKKGESQKNLEAWAKDAYFGVQTLRALFEADETTRDKLIDEILSVKPYREDDIDRRKKQLEEWNPGEKFEGKCYPLNPVAVYMAVYERLGYDNIGEFKLPVSGVGSSTFFDHYELTDNSGKKIYPTRALQSFEDVVDEITYLSKVKNADEDTDHPNSLFRLAGINPVWESTCWRVLTLGTSSSKRPETHLFCL